MKLSEKLIPVGSSCRYASCLSILLVLFCSSTAAQTSPQTADRIRSVSLQYGMAAPELIDAGFLIQLSDQYSIGLMAAVYLPKLLNMGESSLPYGVLSTGLRGTYYFSPEGKNNFLWANAIIVDAQYLLPTDLFGKNYPGGLGLQALVGRDGIVLWGLGINWGVGLAAGLHSNGLVRVTPAVNVGLHFDI